MDKENVKKTPILVKIGVILENILYYLVLIPLVIITLRIVYLQIVEPDRIPDVFGWKIFMILDGKMDENIEYGDLVFTKNIDPNILKNNDLIAFRTPRNTVVLHRITDITTEYKMDEKTKEERDIRTFTLKAAENETNDTKTVQDSKVEGILRKRIPKVGLIILFIQQPLALFGIICIILIIGLICLYIAEKLDERDEERKRMQKELEEKQQQEKEKTTI